MARKGDVAFMGGGKLSKGVVKPKPQSAPILLCTFFKGSEIIIRDWFQWPVVFTAQHQWHGSGCGGVHDGSRKDRSFQDEHRIKRLHFVFIHRQLYGGDSYVILYTYQVNKREHYIIYFWLVSIFVLF